MKRKKNAHTETHCRTAQSSSIIDHLAECVDGVCHRSSHSIEEAKHISGDTHKSMMKWIKIQGEGNEGKNYPKDIYSRNYNNKSMYNIMKLSKILLML